MRVLIADDHELVRDTIAAFLERDGAVTVVSAADFAAVEAALGETPPVDLTLLDYKMPGMNGLAGLTRALALAGGRPVALLSGTADAQVARDALAAGAAGFLPKTLPAKSLVHAVHFMLAGEQYAPIGFMLQREEPEAPDPLAEKLSPRERDVLAGLCEGLSNKEIARNLALQEVTVKLHVRTLCRKIGAKNRTQAALIARGALPA